MHGVMQASQKDVLACVRSLTNLRQLTVHLEWTADTLAALTSLTALTKLHIVAAFLTVSMAAMCALRLACLWLPLHATRPSRAAAFGLDEQCRAQYSRRRAPAALTVPQKATLTMPPKAALTMPQSSCSSMMGAYRLSQAVAGPACQNCTCASGAVDYAIHNFPDLMTQRLGYASTAVSLAGGLTKQCRHTTTTLLPWSAGT
jgi:hypothetical protein